MDLNPYSLAFSIVVTLILWFVYRDHVALNRDKYRTFWPRLWAPAVDELVLWIPMSLLPYIIYTNFSLNTNTLLLLNGIIYFFYYVYSIYFHGVYGATIGKMTTKVRVVDAKTENPITFKQAFMRDSVPVIMYIILAVILLLNLSERIQVDLKILLFLPLVVSLWFLVEVITMLTNKKRRALHDYIAGTVVIRTNIQKTLAEQSGKPAGPYNPARVFYSNSNSGDLKR